MLRTSPNQLKGRGPQSSSAWYPRRMNRSKKNGIILKNREKGKKIISTQQRLEDSTEKFSVVSHMYFNALIKSNRILSQDYWVFGLFQSSETFRIYRILPVSTLTGHFFYRVLTYPWTFLDLIIRKPNDFYHKRQ